MGEVRTQQGAERARTGAAHLVTGSAWTREQVERCAAAAGTAVSVVPPGAAAGAGGAGPRPGLLLVGADSAASLVASGSGGGRGPRRGSAVLVVGDADSPDGVWRSALELGATGVVRLPADQDVLVRALLDAADPRPADGCVVGVVGGRGGAGASCLAAGLAWAAVHRARRAASGGRGAAPAVLLVDADPLGGGLDVLLGLEDAEGLRWPDLAGVRGGLRADVLEGTLPRTGGVDVLAFARAGLADPPTLPEAAAASVVAAARRSHDLVVVDLPRRTGGTWSRLAAEVDVLVALVPAEVRGGVAAHRLLSALGPEDVRLVVRTGPARGGPHPQDVARALGVPLAAVLATDARWSARAEAGDPFGRAGVVLRCAEQVLEGLVPGAGRRGAAAPAPPESVAVPEPRAGTEDGSGRGSREEAVHGAPGREGVRGWRPSPA